MEAITEMYEGSEFGLPEEEDPYKVEQAGGDFLCPH